MDPADPPLPVNVPDSGGARTLLFVGVVTKSAGASAQHVGGAVDSH